MNLSNKISFIKKVFGSAELDSSRLNISVKCPNCSDKKNQAFKKKLVIRLDNNVYHCWVCDIKGRDLGALIRKYKKQYFAEYVSKFSKIKKLNVDIENVVNQDVVLPQGFRLLAQLNNPTQYEKEAIDYIYSRGLTIKDLWYFKFGLSSEKKYYKRIIMPSFDENGMLNYFVTRTWDHNNKIKYINCSVNKQNIIFNDINIDWNDDVTIVEGPFDLVKAPENSTCLLGSTLNEESLLFQKIVTSNANVTLVLDKDANKKMFTIANKFMKYGISINVVVLKTDKDPGDMTKDEFVKELNEKFLWSNKQNIIQNIDLI